MKAARGGKRRGREPAEELPKAQAADKPAKRAKTQAKQPVALVARTAAVQLPAVERAEAAPLCAAAPKPVTSDPWSFEVHCQPKPAPPPRAAEAACVLEAPLAVFEMAPAAVTASSPAAANMPALSSVFARVPRQAVPSDADDAVLCAAVRAVGAELKPSSGLVPRASLPASLTVDAPSCAPFCALRELLAGCPPEEQQQEQAVAAPVVTVPRAAAAAPPARPPRAHTPDLFSSDSEGAFEALAAEAVAAVATEPVQAPFAKCAGPLQQSWPDPRALAEQMLKADPFLAELGVLLCC